MREGQGVVTTNPETKWPAMLACPDTGTQFRVAETYSEGRRLEGHKAEKAGWKQVVQGVGCLAWEPLEPVKGVGQRASDDDQRWPDPKWMVGTLRHASKQETE